MPASTPDARTRSGPDHRPAHPVSFELRGTLTSHEFDALAGFLRRRFLHSALDLVVDECPEPDPPALDPRYVTTRRLAAEVHPTYLAGATVTLVTRADFLAYFAERERLVGDGHSPRWARHWTQLDRHLHGHHPMAYILRDCLCGLLPVFTTRQITGRDMRESRLVGVGPTSLIRAAPALVEHNHEFPGIPPSLADSVATFARGIATHAC